MNIVTIGIDLGKSCFHVWGVDAHGKKVLKRKFTRKKLLEFIVNIPPCLIGMEACGSSNYWARKFRAMGHEVKLMSPQFVKPYVKSNKNDYNDAEAICEAVTRPNMRFVAIKEVEHQDIQSIHRMRKQLEKDRTALVNQGRGLLSEYGVVIPKGINIFRREIMFVLEDSDNDLSAAGREMFHDLYQRLVWLDGKVAEFDNRIKLVYKTNNQCQELGKLPGIGEITATALIASICDPNAFKNGRQLAAWFGLVPRQYSTGGRTVLLGISKRGDKYIRTLLIHGARAVVQYADRKTDSQSLWLQSLIKRRGKNVAAVALANKNARRVWAILMGKEPCINPA